MGAWNRSRNRVECQKIVVAQMQSYHYRDNLRRLIQNNLSHFSYTVHSGADLRSAAVAIVLVPCRGDPGIYNIPFQAGWEDHAAIILTRRSTKLRKHAGQWALPGGQLDDDETVEQAALRELDEEVGLRVDSSQILGRLDDFTTHSGFVISPIAVWGGSDAQLTPNFDEVDTIYRIPLAEFMREDAPMLEESTESNAPILRMPVGDNWIAAPTAALLYQFREVAILGRETSVAHYDQPLFARQ